MFMAGDDESAKSVTAQLVTDLGFEAIDAGPLRHARLLEPYAMIWIDQTLNRGAPSTNAFGFMRKTDDR
jgi:predicted dinucleotide-binding enzyme